MQKCLEYKCHYFDCRPRFPMINELMGWDFDFAFMDYGEYLAQPPKEQSVEG